MTHGYHDRSSRPRTRRALPTSAFDGRRLDAETRRQLAIAETLFTARLFDAATHRGLSHRLLAPFEGVEACAKRRDPIMGFAGSLTMSAIKRDRGVEDYGTLVQGHAGVLDRIDSICFAAPVLFHLTRYIFSDFS